MRSDDEPQRRLRAVRDGVVPVDLSAAHPVRVSDGLREGRFAVLNGGKDLCLMAVVPGRETAE